jgi:hypothetical protein
MGARTDFRIASWQKEAGIEPAMGKRAELLHALSKAAFNLIRIIELEQSGIRDGDGRWYGSCAFTSDVDRMAELCAEMRSFDRAAWLASNPEIKSDSRPIDDGDNALPF